MSYETNNKLSLYTGTCCSACLNIRNIQHYARASARAHTHTHRAFV